MLLVSLSKNTLGREAAKIENQPVQRNIRQGQLTIKKK
jgi:hypothetical protein